MQHFHMSGSAITSASSDPRAATQRSATGSTAPTLTMKMMVVVMMMMIMTMMGGGDTSGCCCLQPIRRQTCRAALRRGLFVSVVEAAFSYIRLKHLQILNLLQIYSWIFNFSNLWLFWQTCAASVSFSFGYLWKKKSLNLVILESFSLITWGNSL